MLLLGHAQKLHFRSGGVLALVLFRQSISYLVLCFAFPISVFALSSGVVIEGYWLVGLKNAGFAVFFAAIDEKS